MSYTDILYDKSSGVATITINRPQVLNAFRTQTILEMTHALEDASADRSVGVIVITGAGERAFCVGGDITEMRDLTPESGHLFCAALQTCYGAFDKLRYRSLPQYAVIVWVVAMKSTWPVI